MKLITLVENEAREGLQAVHGLAFYLETRQHKLLFDLGPDDTIFRNARKLGIDLTAVDMVLISHGHKDHGGALGQFLQLNPTARVYIQRSAFGRHYSFNNGREKDGSLDPTLAAHPQVTLLDGPVRIDDELAVFTVQGPRVCWSPANDALYDADGRDAFLHEQNLLLDDGTLLLGCGHTGIVNILQAAGCTPRRCIGGLHLYNPTTGVTVPQPLLDEIAGHLQQYPDTEFYTCHCTGPDACVYLGARLPNLHTLHAGDALHW